MLTALKTGLRIASADAKQPSAIHMSSACRAARASIALLLFLSLLSLASCSRSHTDNHVLAPSVEITTVPVIGQNDGAGNPSRISAIRGRVFGSKPGQQIVIYARAINADGQLIWFVQPLVKEPFTKIDSNFRWQNVTHPGSEYAVLLVDPGFDPPGTTRTLPTQGVAVAAFTKGEPAVWYRWWFVPAFLILCAAGVFGLHRLRIYEMSRKLHLRFEERLAERTRVAQELHDTLLQGVLSVSMQLHVAVDQLPEDSPVRPQLNRILELTRQVVDEGRNTLRGLRSATNNVHDLQTSFSRIPHEVAAPPEIGFRVIVEGDPLPLQPVIRDDVFSIGREALVNAFRHSRPRSIDVQLQYNPSQLRILVRDDGCGIDPRVLESGRDGHFGLSGMRERAERIGARLKVLSRPGNGTEVELRLPGDIAFESHSSGRASNWLARFYQKPAKAKNYSAERAR